MDFLSFREPFNAWTHCCGLIAAIPGAWLLWRRGRGDRPKQISLLVYGLSLMLCYGGSTLFHGIHTSSQNIVAFEALDHMGIFLLIAGSYTAVCFTLSRGAWKWCGLVLIWAFAATGITLRLAATPIHPWVSTGLYLLMGWGVLLPYFQWARVLSHRALIPVAVGGVFYSFGGLFDRLDLRVFNLTGHEGAHLWIMAGSLVHYWFILHWVAPFPRADALPKLPSEAAPEAEPLPAGLAATTCEGGPTESFATHLVHN
jgi:hemolysin III